MVMNKTRRLKTVTTIVMLLFTLSTVLSFAAPTVFTDIDGHWAKEHIEDIYRRQLTTGYPDGTFKPQGNITKLETIVIIAKLMGYKDSEGQYYVNQYNDQLVRNNIPSWGQGATAYALFNDILLESDLKTLVSTTAQTDAKRHEVATYIGRVLQYGAGEEINTVINVIPYLDEMSIPDIAKPYIELLLNKGILDRTSNDGKFLPNNEITRAEVSKLISMSAAILDELSDDDIIVEPGPITPPPVKRKTVKGSVDNIILRDKNIISIEDENQVQTYEIHPKAKISLNGNTVAVEKLEVGHTITALVEDDLVVNIEAISRKSKLEGYFFYYLQGHGQKPQVFIRDNKGETHTLFFTSSSRAYFMDKAVDIEDLNQGDPVTVTYIDDEIIEIDAEPREKYFEGIVEAKSDSRGENILEVLLEDGSTEFFNITSKATLRRDRRSVSFENIKIGDEVEITTEYDEVTYVNAFSVRRIVEGYIRRLIFGQKTEPAEITVEKHDGTTEIFTLTPDTVIRVGGERTGSYDLRVNYEVELEIENNEVVWVETERRFQGVSYIGKVTYVDARREILELQTGHKEEVEIYGDDETVYLDEKEGLIRLKDIYVGDEIGVFAEDNGYYLMAKKVFVIIRR